MNSYLIASRHEEKECVRAMDEMLAKGTKVLDKFVFGCREGDHTAYAVVDAKNTSEALGILPDFLQDEACITKVEHISPADIRMLHEKAA